MKLQRILVPTDLSAASLSALAVAQEFVGPSPPKIILLHVNNDLPTTAETFAPTPAQYDEAVLLWRRGIVSECKAWMRDNTATLAPQRLRLVVRFGDPVRQIVRYARQHEVDVIVVATHGRSGLIQRLLGGVAQALLRRAPCQVVLVRRAHG